MPRPRRNATKLAQALDQHGVPAYTVAAQARMHPTTLSGYVNGTAVIRPDHLDRLARVLGVPAAQLVGLVKEAS